MNKNLFENIYKAGQNSRLQEYSYDMNAFKQPENIIEEIREIFSNLFNKVKQIKLTN